MAEWNIKRPVRCPVQGDGRPAGTRIDLRIGLPTLTTEWRNYSLSTVRVRTILTRASTTLPHDRLWPPLWEG